MRAVKAIRPPAVSGLFYPGESNALRDAILRYLQAPGDLKSAPKGLIVPHAGYEYSGPVAGSAYACLQPFAQQYRRVVLIGPSHHVGFDGLAVSHATAFETPLGRVPLDRRRLDELSGLPQVTEFDLAHQSEHSLEVQLPFLQVVLPQFELVPLVVGEASTQDVAEVLDTVWDGPETLIVASSDLSHYHDYRTAQRLDAETVRLFEAGQFDQLSGDRACGFMAVRGLLANEVCTSRQ